MLHKIETLLEMIKFKYTVFALPFALMGSFLASHGVPPLSVLFWVVVAMFGARTAAMGFNRIVDRRYDAGNPRTASRALPAGEVSLKESWVMVLLAAAIFFFACAMLNPLALTIAPFALGLTFFYSLTKRFTALCHLILGVAQSLGPFGGWIAVTGTWTGYPVVLSLGVLFWMAGFDTIYACLDTDFDRQAGLHSLPSRLGRTNAFRLAVAFHVLAFVFFILTGLHAGLNGFYFLGVLITAAILFYQHLIVSPRDLTRIQMSFFSLNGFIALTLFFATWLALITSG